MLIYQTTLTQKGQITIPKSIRDALHLASNQTIRLRLAANKKMAVIEPSENFLELAARVKVQKRVNPVQARQQLEQHYDRV